MKKKIIKKNSIDNVKGNGSISILQKFGYKFLSVNGKIHYIEWPLGTPTVDYFYKISNEYVNTNDILEYQEITRNFSQANVNNTEIIISRILKLLQNGNYNIELYQDVSKEIQYHFDRVNFASVNNNILDRFEELWWNYAGKEIIEMDKVIHHPLEKHLDQYYGYSPGDYSYYLATQSVKSLDYALVEHYITEIKGGLTPLIITLDYSLIIDGHHKAMAYSLTNKKPYILNIRNTNKYKIEQNSLKSIQAILEGDVLSDFMEDFSYYLNV